MSALEETIPTTAERSRRRWLLPVATGCVGFLLGIAVTLGATSLITTAQTAAEDAEAKSAAASRLTSAVAACEIDDADNAAVGDGGYTLTVNNKGEDDYTGISYTDLACIQQELKTPASVLSHLEQTTSLDGRQTETWGGVTESWSYHPDRGLDAVFTVERPED